MQLRLHLRWVLLTLRYGGWAPVAVFGLHLLASRAYLYDRFKNFDILMHLLGGGAIGYFFHVGSRWGSQLNVLSPFRWSTHALLVFGWSTVAAVIWEYAEYVSDHCFGTKMQNDDLPDTLKDILLGQVGAALLIITLWLVRRKSRLS